MVPALRALPGVAESHHGAFVERAHALIVIREVVERLAAGLRRKDRALAAGDPLRRLERCRDQRLDHEPAAERVEREQGRELTDDAS